MTKIAFITYVCSSFRRQDYEILSKYYDVEYVTFTGIFDIWKLVTAIRTSDISYTWFASAGAFFAVIASKIFRKKSIVVAGGGDVANEPKINYGVGTQNILQKLMRTLALKYADTVLPVSKFTQHETERYTKNNIKMVYSAVDCEKFKPNGEKEKLVLTVGNTIKLKGIDTFVATARRCSDIMFMIVGISEDLQAELERYCNIPDNLMLVGNVPYNDMVQYYQRAKVYCQLSYRESFGMALAEAMACECIPVVTNRGAISEVVGSEGIYVPFGDAEATVEGIKNAFKLHNFYPREQITSNFSLSRRELVLKNIIDYNLKDSRTHNRLQKTVKIADVHSGETVLDLGCNDSAIKTLLPNDVNYIGLDINNNVNLEKGIPKEYCNNSYDIIFLNEFIEHIENFKSLLIQCRNLLSKNGRIIISTPSPNRVLFGIDYTHIPYLRNLKHDSNHISFGEDLTHIHCFRKSNMYNLVNICNLKIDKITGTYLGIPFIPLISLSQTFLTGVIIYKLIKNIETNI